MNRDWFMKAGQMPIKPPEWSYWIDMKSVELIQAILLSVDIDPRSVPGSFKRPDTPRIVIPHCQELTKRTDIALNHYGKYAFERDDLEQPVELKEFRRWAEQLQNPWVFPNGFPKEVEPETTSISKGSINNDRDSSLGKTNSEVSRSLKEVKVGVLIKRHKVNWQSIKQDVKDATKNGLKIAAKTRHGYYDEEKAVVWAKNRDKYFKNISIKR